MAFRRLNAEQVKTGAGAHPAASPFDKCIGAELGVRMFGLYQVDAVTPDSARSVRAGDGGLVFIAMCAPLASQEGADQSLGAATKERGLSTAAPERRQEFPPLGARGPGTAPANP